MRDALVQHILNEAKITAMVLKYGGMEGAYKGLKFEKFDNEAQRIAVTREITHAHRAGKGMRDAFRSAMRDEKQRRAEEEERIKARSLIIIKLLDTLAAFFTSLGRIFGR